jgi:hypothetical protein
MQIRHEKILEFFPENSTAELKWKSDGDQKKIQEFLQITKEIKYFFLSV